jgi:hypothetical protein
VLIDSCPVELQNDIGSYGLDADAASGGMDAIFHAFELTRDTKITSMKVSLKSVGTPLGASVVCGLYNNLSGEFPNVIPISPWLRQTTYRDMSSISPDGGLYEFDFLLKPSLAAGKYAISVERSGDFTPSGSSIKVGFAFDFDNAGSIHAGNGGFHQNGIWQADDMADLIFYLYGVPL